MTRSVNTWLPFLVFGSDINKHTHCSVELKPEDLELSAVCKLSVVSCLAAVFAMLRLVLIFWHFSYVIRRTLQNCCDGIMQTSVLLPGCGARRGRW